MSEAHSRTDYFVIGLLIAAAFAVGYLVSPSTLNILLSSGLATTIFSVVFSGTVLAAIIAGLFDTLNKSTTSHNEAVSSMWKIADHYMRAYYFPLATAAEGLSQTIEDWTHNKTAPTLMVAFTWYATFRAAADRMSKETFYFMLTSSLAEKSAGVLYGLILEAPHYTALELSTMTAVLGDEITLYEVNKRVNADPAVKAFYSKFENWATTSTKELEKLKKDTDYFSSLITDEVNSLYRPWYGKLPRPEKGQSLSEIAKYLGLS